MDIVKRKLMLVTIGTQRVNSIYSWYSRPEAKHRHTNFTKTVYLVLRQGFWNSINSIWILSQKPRNQETHFVVNLGHMTGKTKMMEQLDHLKKHVIKIVKVDFIPQTPVNQSQ